ncbi:protein UL27 [macacine betaherpesvirus 9]|uniref:Protein UL27 n=1 Tax=macacine betaherpesvirus 9 TaxID=2560568 RepID=A0A192XNS3_9BETA|nr:protein UL27 [macacine betaherpesvirus 9]ANC96537.1 protein UL27 [macacine betaherpesvirus 9]
MDLYGIDIFKGPIKSSITYVIPNHPYLSWTLFNSREIDVNLNELTEDMILDSSNLTAEDLFHIRGLKFRDDSILWTILFGKNSAEFKRREGNYISLKEFFYILESLGFEKNISYFHQYLTKSTALAHFTIAEYVMSTEKKNTLAAHFNRLLELLDSFFLQFLMLRNRCESSSLLHLFELVPNPKETSGDVIAPSSLLLKNFLADSVFIAFATNYDFMAANLCNCDECRYFLFVNFLKKKKKKCSLSDIIDFNVDDLILGQLHLSENEALYVRENINRDLGIRLILSAVELKKLPILQRDDLGKGHLERNILKIYCNITFCLFLARRVRERIDRDLKTVSNFFVRSLTVLAVGVSEINGLESVQSKFSVLASQFETKDTMSVPRLCYSFLETVSVFISTCQKQNHRVRLLIEHMCQRKVIFTTSCPFIKECREIRHDILEGFLGPVELYYMVNPSRFFRYQDCNLYGTQTWSGFYPNVVPYAVRGGGPFEVRVFEHRMRQRRALVRKRLLRELQQRGCVIRQIRRIPSLAICPFIAQLREAPV